MPAAGGGGAREGGGGGLWKRFPPFWASRNAVACGGRKKTIPFSRRKRVLPPSAITGARVEYAVVHRVRVPRGAERKLLLALHLPRAEKEKLISWFVTSILPRRKRKLFLLTTVGRVDEWVLTTLNSSKYTGII